MKFYKIKHLPSGLFFRPSSDVRIPGETVGWTKTNLSKTGKAYSRKPTLKQIGNYFYDHRAATIKRRNCCSPVIASDWEIVEYEVK